MLACVQCTRSYHYRCLKPAYQPTELNSFVCPECFESEAAEKALIHQKGNKILDVEELTELLHFVLNQMKLSKFVSIFLIKNIKYESHS